MFGIPAWFLDLTLSFVGRLASLTGQLNGFVASPCVLMVSIASEIVSVPLRMIGSQPIRVPIWLIHSTPSIFDLCPASNFMPVPSLSPIAAVLLVFNTIEASVWSLEISTFPFDSQHLRHHPACIFEPLLRAHMYCCTLRGPSLTF